MVRDLGLLDAAANRPQASAFGEDAFRLVMSVAETRLDDVAAVADVLRCTEV